MTIPADNFGFANNPVVELLPGGFKARPYLLKEELRYYSEVLGRWVRVPPCYKSDLLSIPWLFRRLLPRGGWGKRAAILHDYLCDERFSWCTSQQACDVFDEALRADECPAWRRRKMVWGVRHFGPRWP